MGDIGGPLINLMLGMSAGASFSQCVATPLLDRDGAGNGCGRGPLDRRLLFTVRADRP